MLPSIQETDRCNPVADRLRAYGCVLLTTLIFVAMDVSMYYSRVISINIVAYTFIIPPLAFIIACTKEIGYKGNIRMVKKAGGNYLRQADGATCPQCGGWTLLECYDVKIQNTRLMPGQRWDPWIPRIHCRHCGAIGKRVDRPGGSFQWVPLVDLETAAVAITPATQCKRGGYGQVFTSEEEEDLTETTQIDEEFNEASLELT